MLSFIISFFYFLIISEIFNQFYFKILRDTMQLWTAKTFFLISIFCFKSLFFFITELLSSIAIGDLSSVHYFLEDAGGSTDPSRLTSQRIGSLSLTITLDWPTLLSISFWNNHCLLLTKKFTTVEVADLSSTLLILKKKIQLTKKSIQDFLFNMFLSNTCFGTYNCYFSLMLRSTTVEIGDLSPASFIFDKMQVAMNDP